MKYVSFSIKNAGIAAHVVTSIATLTGNDLRSQTTDMWQTFSCCRDRSRSREREYRGREEDRKYYEDRYRERERREGDRDRERWFGHDFYWTHFFLLIRVHSLVPILNKSFRQSCLPFSFTGKLGHHRMRGWKRNLAGKIEVENLAGRRGVIVTGNGDRFLFFWKWIPLFNGGRFLPILQFPNFCCLYLLCSKMLAFGIIREAFSFIHTCVLLKNHIWR